MMCLRAVCVSCLWRISNVHAAVDWVAYRIQVVSTISLAQLHRVIQRVMGWEGYHLYQFVVGGREYSDPNMLEEIEGEDACRVTLATLVRGEKDTLLSEYDFGDRQFFLGTIFRDVPLCLCRELLGKLDQVQKVEFQLG